jgi:hypothetical protein
LHISQVIWYGHGPALLETIITETIVMNL